MDEGSQCALTSSSHCGAELQHPCASDSTETAVAIPLASAQGIPAVPEQSAEREKKSDGKCGGNAEENPDVMFGPKKGVRCADALNRLEAQDGLCPGEVSEPPEGYGASRLMNPHARFLPADYSQAPALRAGVLDNKPEGTIWSSDFNHRSSMTVGDVQKILPKPDKMKDVVKYKGPFSQKAVLKQATVNAELQKAVESGDSDRVAAILRFGLVKKCVNVNAPLYPKRERVLHLAAKGDHRDICVMLLEAKAEVDIEEIVDGKHPVHVACASGSYDVVELLLDHKARIEESNFTGMRPIHWAAEAGHEDIVDLLLDRQAKINAASNSQMQAIHYAAKNGHSEVVRLLVKRGVKVDVLAGNKRPVHLACLGGHGPAAAVLMDYGAVGVLEEFCAKGSLKKYVNSPLEEFMRVVEKLRFDRDEAEELCDMGQEDEAMEAFKTVIAGFMEYNLVNSAKSAHSDAAKCGIELEPIEE